MEPLGVQRRYAPHFKGLISGKLEPTAHGRDSTFTLHHTLLKKAILHLKMATVRFDLNTTVVIHEDLKVEEQKKVRLSKEVLTKTDFVYVLSTLTAGHF